MTLDDLIDDIDAKLVGPVSEKEALTPDEYNILMCSNFDVSLREVGLYEYVHDEDINIVNDVGIALKACGAAEWSDLLAAYVAQDSAKYAAMHSGESSEFKPAHDYPAMFEAVARRRGIQYDEYMRVVLEEFASAKGLMDS